MEEETPLRRSSRSRSRTPSISSAISQLDGERVQGMKEVSTRMERVQTIREVVIEGHSEVVLSSSSSRKIISNGDSGAHNDLSLEVHQNAINASQENIKKKRTSKTAEEKVRRPAKKSIANGGSPSKKRVTKKSQVEAVSAESSQDESVAVTSTPAKTQTTKRSSKAQSGSLGLTLESYLRTKASPKASPEARRLFDDAMSGKYDTDRSVFLKFYRNVGEWWNYYKKTDYTYSPMSDQRYEIAPGVYNMPNLSRRPIGSYVNPVSRMQQNFNYNLSREDSDSEEFVDTRRAYRYETLRQEESRQFGLFRKIFSVITYCLLILYTYTIGAVVTGVKSVVNRIRSAFSARSTNDSRSYYYYKETHTLITDGERTEEAHVWTEKVLLFFAWIYSGVTRNWGKLLLLLLLVLLGYSVYTGDFYRIKGDLSEKAIKLSGNVSDNFFELTENVKTASQAYYQIMWDKWNETDIKGNFVWPEWLPILEHESTEQEPMLESPPVVVEEPAPVTIEEPVVA